MELEGSELKDPTPDIHALFCHYNALYFQDVLGACTVSWSSDDPMDRCTGTCDYYPDGACEIRISEPLLRFRSNADLKNTLLHEMIHAFLWMRNKIKNHSDHGTSFQSLINTIHSSSLIDHEKPLAGYNITANHDIHEEVDSNNAFRWICNSCGNLIKRTMNREPSVNDCIEKVGHDVSCGNPSCQWHSHKNICSGNYTKEAEPGERELHTDRFKGLRNERSPRRSCRIEGMMEKSDAHKTMTITNFLLSGCDEYRSSGNNSSGSDTQKEHFIDSKTLLKHQSSAAVPEMPRRTRNGFKRKNRCAGGEQTKCAKRKREYNLIIAWVGVYTDEESEEDVEPLINKRTERRKKQKLLQDLIGQDPVNEVMTNASPSNTNNYRDEEDPYTAGPAEVGGGREPAKTQSHVDGSYEGASPLNLSLKDDIVDVSDG